jgi:hypothetical protein
MFSCTHQEVIKMRAKYFAMRNVQFLRSLVLFDPSSFSGLQALTERKHHLSQSHTGKFEGGNILMLRKFSKGQAQAITYSKT